MTVAEIKNKLKTLFSKNKETPIHYYEYELQVIDFDYCDNQDDYSRYIFDALEVYRNTNNIGLCQKELNDFFEHIYRIEINRTGTLKASGEKNYYGNSLNDFKINEIEQADTFCRAVVDLNVENQFKEFIRNVVKEYEEYKYLKRKEAGYYNRY